MLAAVTLQFEGVQNAGLLALLAAGVAVALLAYGLWRVVFARGAGAGVAYGATSTVGRSVGIVIVGVAAVAGVILAAARLPMTTRAHKLAWLALLAGLIVVAVSTFYANVFAYLGRRRMTALLLLRFLAILALLMLLFKPALSVAPSAEEYKPVLAVMVDRSGSMDTIDQADMPNRYRQAVEALAAQQDRLRGQFRVRYGHFAEAVQSVDNAGDLAELSPTGPGTESTDLAAAIRAASAGYRADELAGVILISDGIHNAEGDARSAAGESLAPIYAVGIGSDKESAAGRRNVRLAGVDGPLEAVRHNVTEVTAQVRLTGWANIPTKVALSEGGKELDAKAVRTDANAETVTVSFQYTPGDAPAGLTGPDLRRLTVLAQPNPAEASGADNAAELHLLVGDPSVRVLYVEGTMRPEFKYLRRVLATDPNLKSMSLVRMDENRFLSQGTIDGKRLTDLPRTDEEFKFFDVLILGDLDRTFLSGDQMEKVRKFVDDGGALLMLGGRSSFGPGGYGGTPVEAALPVVCGPRSMEQETTPFLPQLTAAGKAAPVFAGLGEHFGSPAGKAADPLPELLGCVTVQEARPGAQVLAVHPTRRNQAGPLVVLAVQNYGKGRSAAFTADTTWQWYLRLRPQGGESPYHRFWGQLVRYLAWVEEKDKAKSSSVVARLPRTVVRLGDELRVTALVKGADGQPTSDATVTARLTRGGEATAPPAAGAPATIELTKAEAGGGLYEATYRPPASGAFKLSVKATGEKGAELGTDELPLTVEPRSKETDRLARDAATLKAIADARQGRYAELPALPDVVDEIIQRRLGSLAPRPEARQFGLANFPLLFIIFVGLLTAEWLLRRNWQLQ